MEKLTSSVLSLLNGGWRGIPEEAFVKRWCRGGDSGLAVMTLSAVINVGTLASSKRRWNPSAGSALHSLLCDSHSFLWLLFFIYQIAFCFPSHPLSSSSSPALPPPLPPGLPPSLKPTPPSFCLSRLLPFRYPLVIPSYPSTSSTPTTTTTVGAIPPTASLRPPPVAAILEQMKNTKQNKAKTVSCAC